MPIARADTLLTDARIRQYEDDGSWNVPTFPELLDRNARECPDRIAYVDDRGAVTWQEVWRHCRRLGGHLLRVGVARGDVVGIQLPNRVEFIYALGAINMVGAIACPYVAALRQTEVRQILRFSGAVATFVPGREGQGFDYRAMLDALREDLPALRTVIVVGGAGAPERDALDMADLLAEDPDVPDLDAQLASRAPGVHDLNRMLFTSGSTGDPKAVMHTAATSVFSNYQVNAHLRVTRSSVLLLFIPITLNWGMFQVIQTAVAQCRLILHRDFDAIEVLRTIERERVTHLGGPPTALIAILRPPSIKEFDLSSLGCYVTSGTSCPIELLRQCRRELGCSIIEGYGMTECGWIAATTRDDDPDAAVGTVGRPFPAMEIRLLEIAEDRDVADGAPGEIAMRGPTVCVGYYNNDERNRATWTGDGWFRSGDLGTFDAAGRLRIVGRVKDMIKHGGATILPREIEELLFTHRKIADAAVVGYVDAYFGENACACVVPKPDQQIDLGEIIAFLQNRIARYKLPQRVELFDRLPYTATGKIQKHLLAAEVRRRIGSERVQAAS